MPYIIYKIHKIIKGQRDDAIAGPEQDAFDATLTLFGTKNRVFGLIFVI